MWTFTRANHIKWRFRVIWCYDFERLKIQKGYDRWKIRYYQKIKLNEGLKRLEIRGNG